MRLFGRFDLGAQPAQRVAHHLVGVDVPSRSHLRAHEVLELRGQFDVHASAQIVRTVRSP